MTFWPRHLGVRIHGSQPCYTSSNLVGAAMQIFYIFIILLLLANGGLIIFSLRKKPKQDDSSVLMLQQQMNQQMNNLSQVLDSKLSESNKSMQSQFGQANTVIRNVTEKLTQITETNKQVVSVAEQLRGLEDILKNPKQRGILGEYYLEELLKNVFSPSQYQMQYKFKDGAIVDAVIFAKDKLIPIDSKFSLENYNRIVVEKDPKERERLEKLFKQDLKTRIDETSKYIRQEEGTLGFAFMFIPAEAIYYDLLVNKVGAVQVNTRDLLEYAIREKNVHIVSPTSFYAYLQTILQGLRAFQIEQSTQEIRKGVELLGKHLAAYDSYMQKLGNQLGTTCKTYSTAYKELGKIDKDIAKITDGERKIEPVQIDKPDILE